MVKKTHYPVQGVDSTPIMPPWRSTIFLQTARLMQVPLYPPSGYNR
jgi:hypothetical protein